MTDDLVKRLESSYAMLGDPLHKEAADRIEQLEAALREIAQAVGDPAAYWIARAALGEKKD
jgi:hypothetical protein